MAEHEGRLISERTKAGLAAAKARGVSFRGNARHFTPEMRARDAAKAAITRMTKRGTIYADLIPRITAMRQEGATARAIADFLNRDGHRNQYSKPWLPDTVTSLCLRERIPAAKHVTVKDETFWANIRKALEASLAARRAKTEAVDRVALPIAIELMSQ